MAAVYVLLVFALSVFRVDLNFRVVYSYPNISKFLNA